MIVCQPSVSASQPVVTPRQGRKRVRQGKGHSRPARRAQPVPLAPELPLRYPVASLEHWLDLNA